MVSRKKVSLEEKVTTTASMSPSGRCHDNLRLVALFSEVMLETVEGASEETQC